MALTKLKNESFGQLVVARGNAPEVFDATEKALDEVAMTVNSLAPSNRLASIGPWRDQGLGAGIANALAQSAAAS